MVLCFFCPHHVIKLPPVVMLSTFNPHTPALYHLSLTPCLATLHQSRQRDFSTAMSNKDQEGFYRGTRRYVTILLAAAPLFALSKFVQGKLGLDWRRWLTEHMCGLYFSNRSFYLLKIGYLSGSSKDNKIEKSRGEEQGGGIDNPVSVVSTDTMLLLWPLQPVRLGLRVERLLLL